MQLALSYDNIQVGVSKRGNCGAGAREMALEKVMQCIVQVDIMLIIM